MVTTQQLRRPSPDAPFCPLFCVANSGTYAEYVAVEEEHLASAPKTVPLSKAGTIPLVALTAWQVTRMLGF